MKNSQCLSQLFFVFLKTDDRSFRPFYPELYPGPYYAFKLESFLALDHISLYLLFFYFTITFRYNKRCLPTDRYKIYWQVVQIKHFTAPPKMPNCQFSRTGRNTQRPDPLTTPTTPHHQRASLARVSGFFFSWAVFTKDSFLLKAVAKCRSN